MMNSSKKPGNCHLVFLMLNSSPFLSKQQKGCPPKIDRTISSVLGACHVANHACLLIRYKSRRFHEGGLLTSTTPT